MEMKGNCSSVCENIYEISEDVQVASQESTAVKGNSRSEIENTYDIPKNVQAASQKNTAVEERTPWLKTGLLAICLVVTIAFASATIALFAKTASNKTLQEESFSKLNMITSNHNQTIEKTKSKTTDVEKLTMDSHEKISVLSEKLEKQLAMIEANFNKSFAELRDSDEKFRRLSLAQQKTFTSSFAELRDSDDKLKQLLVAQQANFTSSLADLQEQSKKLKLEMENNRDSLWRLGSFTASNGFQYKFTKTSQNFQDSRDACARMGGHLAYIGVRNAKIHSEILQNIGKGWTHLFVDLRDVEVEGQFRWGDGVLASIGWTKWPLDQPDNHKGVEHCVHIREDSQTWNDVPCSTNNKALCERRVK